MKARLAAGAILLSLGTTASAHRLDEYLQATVISVEKNRLQAQVRLTPGVAVFPIVFASIDTDRDGVLSEPEQQAYAERVLGDLSLTIDGDRLRPRLVSVQFPRIAEMKEGLGEIDLELMADLPPNGPNRRLIFENHHQSRIAAYLVNCLVPRNSDIRLVTQNRNYQQSFYQLDYVQAGVSPNPLSFAWWSGLHAWVGGAALLLFVRLAVLLRQRA
jgi:hypothetical protein